MRIRKLELHGFKSFPDKTQLHFGSGIACVVGPNGCGKSNIVDAIKWCVGEQSAKSLRGEDMADVIFAGSAERQSVGFAEVTISFSAEGGDPFPGEYSRFTELSVGRRLNRNGTSEYLINGARVRRKDLIELFLDTGIGNNLYSFIEQGRIGEIIHASPERRRGLIDEAAGITRYQAKRDEAQAQLEATATQLDRAADVAEEMGTRLRVLEGQVLRAARFRRFRAMIRLDEILLGLVKYADLAADRRETRASLTQANQDAATAEREVTRREAELTARRDEVELIETSANALRDELADVEARVRELEGARGFEAKARQELDDAIARSTKAQVEGETAASAARIELADLTGRAETMAFEVEIADEDRTTLRAAADTAAKERQLAKAAVGAGDKASAEAGQAYATERARVDELDRRAALLPVHLDRARTQLDGARKELDVLRERKTKLIAAVEARRFELELAQQATENALAEVGIAAAAEEAARADVKVAEAAELGDRKTGEAAVQAASSAVSRTESEHRGLVGAAEKALVDGINRARAAGDAAVAEAQRQSRQRVDDAEKRQAAWLSALEKHEAGGTQALERRLVDADRAADADERLRLERLEKEGAASVRAAEASAQQEAKERLDKAIAERDGARARLEAALAQKAKLEAAHAERSRELQGALGRQRGLEGEAAAEQGREAGAMAIRKALPNAKPLLDQLSLGDGQDWVGAVLDERLLAPVVRSADDVRKAAAAVKSAGRALVFLAEGAVTLEGVLAGTAIVDDLDAALAHQAATHTAAVVRTTGERVEADGLVRLGPTGGAATRAIKRQREVAALVASIAELQAAADALLAQRGEVERGLPALRAAIDVAEKAVRAEEERGRIDVRQKSQAAGEAARAAVDAETRQQRDAQGKRRAARDEAIAAARQQGIARIAEDTARGREVARQIREQADVAVDAVRRAQAETADRTRTEGELALAERRRTAEQALAEARVAVDAARAAAAQVTERHRAEVAELRAKADGLRKGREAKDAHHAAARAHQFTAEVAVARADGDVATIQANDDRLVARIVEIQTQIDAIYKEEQELRASLAVSRGVLEQRLTTRDAAVESLQAANRTLAAIEVSEEAARKAAADANVRLAQLRERLAALKLQATTAARLVDEADARRIAAEGRLAELTVERAAAAEREETVASASALAAAQKAERAQTLAAERERLITARKAHRDSETAQRDALERRDSTTRHAAELDGRARELQAEIEGLCERLDERYQVSLPGLLDRVDSGRLSLVPDDGLDQPLELAGERVEPVGTLAVTAAMLADPDLVRERVQAIEENRARLTALGDVNLAAVEEYRDVAARYADLAAQRTDLEESVASIREAIAKMNKLCRQRFREAFDRVNENFQANYPRLVGGGSARLSLTDEEDLLETGVDIFVQPPGKRLQNLTLLSGGEKAMAAIALLLSLFQVKPSPFCLLDEVDAPLDEANGARFNDMVREMSGVSQFIVITHNRKTMEAADTLYGITMPTPGVSRLVSVRIGA